MLLLGVLAIWQAVFLPGYLCLRALRFSTRGLLQTFLYSFALSLLANHLGVYALTVAGLYSPPVVYTLTVMEWAVLIRFWWREKLDLTLPSAQTVQQYRRLWNEHPAAGRAVVWLAWAVLLLAAALWASNLGSVFAYWDDAVSWDRWAVQWAHQIPVYEGYYPQLLPANWSLTYVITGNTDIKLFATAFMPLFIVVTLLTFLDLFHQTGKVGWLMGLILCGCLLHYIYRIAFLRSGYADLPSACLAFVALYAILQTEWRPDPLKWTALALPIVLASAALVTKQGAVYFFVITLVWLIVRWIRRPAEFSWRRAAIVALLAVALTWWYVETAWKVAHHEAPTNLSHLVGDIHGGRTYPQRWTHAWQLLTTSRAPAAAPAFELALGLFLLSLLHPVGRRFAVLFFPFFVCWALWFSYEARTIGVGLPFAAAACGFGAEWLWDRHFSLEGRLRSAPLKWLARACTAAFAGLIVLGTFWLGGSGDSLVASLVMFRLTEWWDEIRTIWPWALAGSAAILVLLAAIRRREPPHVRLPVTALLAATVIVPLALQLTLLPDEFLISQQLERRKGIGSPELNQKLYALRQRGELEGRILTDYWPLRELPQLNRQFQGIEFAGQVSQEWLTKVSAMPGVRYLLSWEGNFSPPVWTWMQAAGYTEIIKEKGEVLIRVPAAR